MANDVTADKSAVDHSGDGLKDGREGDGDRDGLKGKRIRREGVIEIRGTRKEERNGRYEGKASGRQVWMIWKVKWRKRTKYWVRRRGGGGRGK